MTEAPVKTRRSRKLKQDKPLTEAEQKEVTEFEKSRNHYLTEESTKDVPEGGFAANAVTLCGIKMPTHITRSAYKNGNICPICAMVLAERAGVLGL